MFRKRRTAATADPAAPVNDWTDLEAIRREWPAGDLDADADLAAWREGNELYDARDDYASMIRAGGLLAAALRHELHGSRLLFGGDLLTTVHRVLYASSATPPDGRTLTQQAASQLRLALTVVKKHGWQSPEMGGDGTMQELISASFFIFGSAIAPRADQPWTGDLRAFFTTGTIEIAEQAPAPLPVQDTTKPPYDNVIASMQQTLADADEGDAASQARLRAIALSMQGDDEQALELYEESARLGHVVSMHDAGCTARELGRDEQGVRWFEAAAAAGHADSMFNLGALALQRGDVATATGWYERAAAAGDRSGYAALTQIADDADDERAALRWSGLGADAGHPFCLMRHAQLQMSAAPDDHGSFRDRWIPMLLRAAEEGQDGAQFLLGIAYGSIGDPSTARLWLKRAEAAGDADATRVLRTYGLE